MVYGFIAEPWSWDPGSYLTHEQYSGVQWAGTLHPQPQERGAEVGLLKPGGEGVGGSRNTGLCPSFSGIPNATH